MLTYKEFRSVAKDGDLMFLVVDKSNILSRITSWFTQSPFTHVAFVFWYKDRLMCVESTTHGGQRLVNASVYGDREMTFVPLPDGRWSDIESKALENIGTVPYGWFSAVWLGLRDFCLNNFGWRLPENKNNRNKACSEFVAETLGLSETDLSPNMLYDRLK